MAGYIAFDAPTFLPHKRIKIAQACDQCRIRKRKCDAVKPCIQCTEDNVTCEWAPPKPAERRDQSVTQVPKQLRQYMKMLDAQTQKLNELSIRFERLEGREHPMPDTQDRISTFGKRPESTVRYAGAHDSVRAWPTVAQLLGLAGDGLLDCPTPGVELPEYSYRGFPVAIPMPSTEVPSTFSHNSSHCRFTYAQPSASTGELGMTHRNDDFRHALFQSFVKNLHVMHPIVDLKYLQTILDKTPDPSAGDDSRMLGYHRTVISCSQPERPLKRAREDPYDSKSGNLSAARAWYQSQDALDHALAYLVLALGAVCMENEIEQYPRELILYQESLRKQLRDGHMPVKSYSQIDSPTPRAHSTKSDAEKKALQQIAIKYHLEAMKILSHHKEGMDLVHAQLFVLAGLYEGQRGEVVRSNEWIRAAGHVAQLLLTRYELLHTFDPTGSCEDFPQTYSNMQRLAKMPEHDYVILLAWSCIQLEGDILSEVSLRPSGIQAYEKRIPWPYRIPNADAYERLLPKDHKGNVSVSGHTVLVCYTSQLWMRRWLNDVEAQLYGHGCEAKSNKQLRSILKEHQATLGCWRECLPQEVQWNDSDAPAGDILAARLRATYFGAQFTITRMYLDYMLHAAPGTRSGGNIPNLGLPVSHPPRHITELRCLEAVGTMSPLEIMEGSERCIKAALEYTIAFDRIAHKLTVPNFQRIARVQFEIVLVLIAASFARIGLIVQVDLCSLLERTVTFLNQYASESRTCKIDSALLQNLLPFIYSRS